MTSEQTEALQSVGTSLSRKEDELIGQQLLPQVVENVLGSIGGRSFHNFTGDPMTVWRLVAIATGPDVIPAKDCLDTPIMLTNFHCQQVQIAGATAGEYSDALRVVLIDKDGMAYGFTSDGVAKDLARLIATFGMGPYPAPIPIKVVQFNTRLGRRAYSIQPL